MPAGFVRAAGSVKKQKPAAVGILQKKAFNLFFASLQGGADGATTLGTQMQNLLKAVGGICTAFDSSSGNSACIRRNSTIGGYWSSRLTTSRSRGRAGGVNRKLQSTPWSTPPGGNPS